MTRADLAELDGLPEAEWTLGQVLTEETGPLFYEYDFGDGWGPTPDMVRNQVRSSWVVFAQLDAIGELSALDVPVPPEGRAFARAVLQS